MTPELVMTIGRQAVEMTLLMSMGMMMMSPVMVSLPFKLMLFVLVDGWHLLMGSLVMSFSP